MTSSERDHRRRPSQASWAGSLFCASVREDTLNEPIPRQRAITTAMTDESLEFRGLVEGVRTLDSQGKSDEEVATWLKARTADFGGSGKVLAHARGITKAEALDELRATNTWRRVETRFEIVSGGEFQGEYQSVNGRTFIVGDELKLPGGPWRVLAVDTPNDPRISARLMVKWIGVATT